LVVSRATLVTVPVLTLGDLLLWHWSLAGGHDLLALVSGLTFLPLLVASIWLLVITLVRVLARGARRPFARLNRSRGASVAAVKAELGTVPAARTATRAAEMATSAGGRDGTSRKIAA
jgi:hypothetical protein